MEGLKSRVSHLEDSFKSINITQEALNKCGLTGINLRDYQICGINWLGSCYLNEQQNGCILGDEMGLGKTIQTLSFLAYNYQNETKRPTGPSLILAPLSVLGNWKSELERYTPCLKLLEYVGDKDQRQQFRDSMGHLANSNFDGWKTDEKSFDVMLTSYEICLKDSSFLNRFKWDALVVDEAHRLKNSKSLLYCKLTEFCICFKVLLTGTPVQNNLQEIYSLLSFICPRIFKLCEADQFVEYFQNIVSGMDSESANELTSFLKPFLLRRKKDEVMADIPTKSEVILHTKMSSVQKKLYKAILSKDLDALLDKVPQKSRLINILMELRKCCNHPYIFPGIEPEPFEMGEHLISASGKLSLLDKILKFLNLNGHRVLIFSQFTTMLDILQDYLTYKGYAYERLDGSVRGEERYLAVNNFNQSNATFVFLLSTRAGGQGLNLMTADTVIFFDNDFNPQNDLQAAARAHRIGQKRPVKVIRLLSKCTVEEIILKRALSKLKLTETVLEGGQFSNLQKSLSSANELPDILKYGLENLMNTAEGTEEDEEIESLLGGSANGEWIIEENKSRNEIVNKQKDEQTNKDNIYLYEGQDYSKFASNADRSAFDLLIAENSVAEERSSRRDKNTTVLLFQMGPKRARRELTEEEKIERKKKREENAAKRAKLIEDEKERKKEQQKLKREKLWKESNYETMNVVNDESDESDNEIVESEEDNSLQINYVVGDVLQPVETGSQDAIVIHCVDNSGYWGRGGLFSAISSRSSNPERQYELAGKMKDLNLGDAHLIPIDDKISRQNGRDLVALIVCQSRDRNNRLSPIDLNALTKGFEKVQKIAKRTKASIHLPRIGYNSTNFNWYATERIIRKLFTSNGIPTFIYYFPRRKQGSNTVRDDNVNQEETKTTDVSVKKENRDLLDIFSGMSFYFHQIDNEERKQLSRYIIAYDGEIVDLLDESTSHVIINEEQPQMLPITMPADSKKITIEQLKKFIRNGTMVDEQ